MDRPQWPRDAMIGVLAIIGLYVLGVPLGLLLAVLVTVAIAVGLLVWHRVERSRQQPGGRRDDPPASSAPGR